jgi:hypothetical protein
MYCIFNKDDILFTPMLTLTEWRGEEFSLHFILSNDVDIQRWQHLTTGQISLLKRTAGFWDDANTNYSFTVPQSSDTLLNPALPNFN